MDNLPTDPIEDRKIMAAISARLEQPEIEEFFIHGPHRKAATRALLDLLGVPLPHWAQRNIGGRAAVTKAAMNRFREDHPHERTPR
ncbi:MAG: hypothetical protein RIC51_05215 [Erythrobacter sp.]|uniref:hypothetical protein n=1 Tax=Erythrobacter sp. TaxID=1042 RepID=UPI0032EBFA17